MTDAVSASAAPRGPAGPPAAGPRERVRMVLRGRYPDAGLWAPLAHALAAQIEGLDPHTFLCDPTKLANGLDALQRALETDALVTCCAAGVEAEAAGATLDWSTYPPAVASPPATGPVAVAFGGQPGALDDTALGQLTTHPRLAAALEATRRLVVTAADRAVPMAALTGPWTLARQIAGRRVDGGAVELAARVAVDLTKRFCQAGVRLVVMLEDEPPEDPGPWRTAAGPVAKVARFHQALPLLVIVEPPRAPLVPPAGCLLCTPAGQETDPGSLAAALPPSGPWALQATPPALATTAGEVPADADIAVLRAASVTVRATLAG